MMNKNSILSIALILIAIVMIVISIVAQILPPGLTGMGFILIAIYMMNNKTD